MGINNNVIISFTFGWVRAASRRNSWAVNYIRSSADGIVAESKHVAAVRRDRHIPGAAGRLITGRENLESDRVCFHPVSSMTPSRCDLIVILLSNRLFVRQSVGKGMRSRHRKSNSGRVNSCFAVGSDPMDSTSGNHLTIGLISFCRHLNW